MTRLWMTGAVLAVLQAGPQVAHAPVDPDPTPHRRGDPPVEGCRGGSAWPRQARSRRI